METKMNRSKPVALTGAVVGFVTFLGIALLPSLTYGGFSGLLLAQGIFGSPVPDLIAARGLVGFGMILGTMGTASVFTVAGAAVFSFLFNHRVEIKKELTPQVAK
jgi:hypothetical protein